MKQKYIVPEIKVTQMLTESALAGASGGDYHFPGMEEAKEYNSFWGSWANEEEEEAPMFQQSKSLWED